MAIYRSIRMTFWTDTKIAEDFTPEDRYFYLYLMTNPHTNLPGCYEISIRQMSIETGYNPDTISKLLERMDKVHHVLKYKPETKEILLFNWRKYNWTTSNTFLVALKEQTEYIKDPEFKQIVEGFIENDDMVSIPYEYPMDTSVSVSVSVTDINNKPKKEKEVKHKYGEYEHVLLSDKQYERLVADYGEEAVLEGIKNVDEYCQMKKKSYNDYSLTLRKWGITKPKLQEPKAPEGKKRQWQ